MASRRLKWTPFERANTSSIPVELLDELRPGELEQLMAQETWVNSRYQVNIDRIATVDADGNPGPDALHVSIKTHDKRPVRDWRDFQRIKNELIGPEHELVELYPAESRLVDTVNQYHLWGYDDPAFRWPVGYQTRDVRDHGGPNTRQRPHEKE